jgi:hypothetical protein
MKNAGQVMTEITPEYSTPTNSNLLIDLTESEREIRKLKDHIYGLKMIVGALVLFMIFWFAVDIVFRALGWFKSF